MGIGKRFLSIVNRVYGVFVISQNVHNRFGHFLLVLCIQQFHILPPASLFLKFHGKLNSLLLYIHAHDLHIHDVPDAHRL